MFCHGILEEALEKYSVHSEWLMVGHIINSEKHAKDAQIGLFRALLRVLRKDKVDINNLRVVEVRK